METLFMAPDLIFHNAKIYTVDAEQPWAEAIAIRKHRIIAIGRTIELLPMAGTDTRLIDLNGKLVLPGLCDAHIHLTMWALGLRELRLADCLSKTEMLARVGARAASSPAGTWLTGQGWNESRWGETAFPTAADLDAVTGAAHPAILWRSDMHGAVVNTAALRMAGITAETPNPAGGVIDRDSQGKPTGFLRELAIDLVSRHLPGASAAEIDAAMKAGIEELHRLGITAVHAQRIKEGADGALEWASLLRLRENRQLALRVSSNIAARDLPHLLALGLRTGFGDQFLRIGHVKVFTDGSLGTRSAWMLAPFVKLEAGEPDNLGVSVTPPEQMAREFRLATESGFPISVHAIGDRANRVCLDIFEELADSGLEPPIPHRIEHVQIIAPEDLPRLAQLKITASVQPIHATDDMDTADTFLGPRGAHAYNFPFVAGQRRPVGPGQRCPRRRSEPLRGLPCSHSAPAPGTNARTSLVRRRAHYIGGYDLRLHAGCGTRGWLGPGDRQPDTRQAGRLDRAGSGLVFSRRSGRHGRRNRRDTGGDDGLRWGNRVPGSGGIKTKRAGDCLAGLNHSPETATILWPISPGGATGAARQLLRHQSSD